MRQVKVTFHNRRLVWTTRIGVALIATPWLIAVVLAFAGYVPRTWRECTPAIVLSALEGAGMIMVWWASKNAKNARYPDAKSEWVEQP